MRWTLDYYESRRLFGEPDTTATAATRFATLHAVGFTLSGARRQAVVRIFHQIVDQGLTIARCSLAPRFEGHREPVARFR